MLWLFYYVFEFINFSTLCHFAVLQWHTYRYICQLTLDHFNINEEKPKSILIWFINLSSDILFSSLQCKHSADLSLFRLECISKFDQF